MKRIFLFLATNIAVLVVIRVVLAVLGIHSTDQVGSLLVYSAVVGFAGSIISLLMSKSIAKNSVGAEVIVQPRNQVEAWLLATVEAQARQWSLKTPEVAIYHSPEPNAFATGATRNSSLIAVSTGLLERMTRDEVEAVLAHEMAHVGNGDMVTLTLIQGVVNTFVVFLARIVSGMIARNNDGSTSQGTYFSQHGIADRVRLFGKHHRDVVQPSARIPCGCRRRQTGRRAQNDCRAATLERQPERFAAANECDGYRQRCQRFFAQHPPLFGKPDCPS